MLSSAQSGFGFRPELNLGERPDLGPISNRSVRVGQLWSAFKPRGRAVDDVSVGAPARQTPTAVDMEIAGVVDRIDCVLACATADEAAVRNLLDRIAAQGLSPRLVGGVEGGIEAFRDAIVDQVEGGLIVLCVSAAIDRGQARRLAEVFNLHRGASQQLLVAGMDRDSPSAVLSPIHRASIEFRRRREMPSPSCAGMKASDQSCSVSGSSLSFDAAHQAEDALQDVASVVLDSRLRDEVGVIPETIVFSAVRRSRPRSALPADADSDRATLELLPVLTPISDRADTDPEALDVTDVQVPVAVRHPGDVARRRSLWAVATAGASAAVAISALVAFTSPDDAPTKTPVSVVSPELSLRAQGPAPTAVERADTPTEAASASAESNEPSVPPEGDRLDSSDATLAEAAADGRLYGLTGFYATRPYAAASAWWAAANRCRSRSVAGVRGWRLPKPAELRAIWRTNRIRDAVYWSSAKAVRAESPSNWALDGRAGLLVAREKADLAATICVRSRLSKKRAQPGARPSTKRR